MYIYMYGYVYLQWTCKDILGIFILLAMLVIPEVQFVKAGTSLFYNFENITSKRKDYCQVNTKASAEKRNSASDQPQPVWNSVWNFAN